MLTGLETRFVCRGSVFSPCLSPGPGDEGDGSEEVGDAGITPLLPPGWQPLSFKDNVEESLESERKTLTLPFSYHNFWR